MNTFCLNKNVIKVIVIIHRFFSSLASIVRYCFKHTIAIVFFYLGGIWFIRARCQKNQALLILNYHNFSRYNNYIYNRGNILETNFKLNFEKQLSFLRKHFKFCYPEEFFNSECKSGLNLLFTFDDGYKDNAVIALPLLIKYDISAIFFLTTSYIGTDKWLFHDRIRYLICNGVLDECATEKQLRKLNQGLDIDSSMYEIANEQFPASSPGRIMMDWTEVNSIIKAGFHVGTHTVSHANLSQINEEDQRKEIQQSIEVIFSATGMRCDTIAYPNGLFGKNTLELLPKLGLTYGFTTENGINKKNTNHKLLKRIGVNPSDSIPILALKLFRQTL